MLFALTNADSAVGSATMRWEASAAGHSGLKRRVSRSTAAMAGVQPVHVGWFQVGIAPLDDGKDPETTKCNRR